MKMTNKLKSRFVKDYKIPIRIFDEPYFSERLALFNIYYDSLNKYNQFVKMLESYNNEEDYFAEYNRIKDAAISFIKSTNAYIRFNEEDPNNFKILNNGLPNKDIFHDSNVNHKFISIDMKKANFSSLKFYSNDIFDGANTWEDFLRKFTNNEYIINSKYIREVILGNCNPKRHITYEKYLMDSILNKLLTYDEINIKDIVFFSNDEIIFDVTNHNNISNILNIITLVTGIDSMPPFRIEVFTLKKAYNAINNTTYGYIKTFEDGNMDFKCFNNLMLPFVIRTVLNEKPAESDAYFEYENMTAKLIDIPVIKIS